jgi:hypothetical protein
MTLQQEALNVASKWAVKGNRPMVDVWLREAARCGQVDLDAARMIETIYNRAIARKETK